MWGISLTNLQLNHIFNSNGNILRGSSPEGIMQGKSLSNLQFIHIFDFDGNITLLCLFINFFLCFAFNSDALKSKLLSSLS